MPARSAVIAVGAAIAADAPDTAGGTFKSKAVTLEIRSAIAFKAKSSLGSDDALIVAVTNATMHADALADYYDRRRAVEKRIKDDDTGVVYFEFRPDGTIALSGVESGQAYTSEGRWQAVKQDGDLMTIKSTEHTGKEKDINIEFDGKDTFYIPLAAPLAQGAEVAELGAMRFTRLR